MKPIPAIPLCAADRSLFPARRKTVAGFTLVEMMFAMTIFTIMLVGGMVAVQIFGMRVNTLAATKLIATQNARQTLNSMRDQIRDAQQVYVGTFTNGTFTQASGLQIGNAVEIFTTTNMTASSTNFVVFYQDPSTNEVFCYSNNPANKWVVAQYMTNYYCFDAEDYRSWIYPTNIMTNYVNNPVIGVTLSFSQWEYPVGYASGSTNGVNAYDYYYLRTHVTRRCKQ